MTNSWDAIFSDVAGQFASDHGLARGWFDHDWRLAEVGRLSGFGPRQRRHFEEDLLLVLYVEWLVNPQYEMPLLFYCTKGGRIIRTEIGDRRNRDHVNLLVELLMWEPWPLTLAGVKAFGRLLLDLPGTPSGYLAKELYPDWKAVIGRKMAAAMHGRVNAKGEPDPGVDADADDYPDGRVDGGHA